jgi:hypothetical protein
MMGNHQLGHVPWRQFTRPCERDEQVIRLVTFDVVPSELCDGVGPMVCERGCKNDTFALGQLAYIVSGWVRERQYKPPV